MQSIKIVREEIKILKDLIKEKKSNDTNDNDISILDEMLQDKIDMLREEVKRGKLSFFYNGFDEKKNTAIIYYKTTPYIEIKCEGSIEKGRQYILEVLKFYDIEPSSQEIKNKDFILTKTWSRYGDEGLEDSGYKTGEIDAANVGIVIDELSSDKLVFHYEGGIVTNSGFVLIGSTKFKGKTQVKITAYDGKKFLDRISESGIYDLFYKEIRNNTDSLMTLINNFNEEESGATLTVRTINTMKEMMNPNDIWDKIQKGSLVYSKKHNGAYYRVHSVNKELKTFNIVDQNGHLKQFNICDFTLMKESDQNNLIELSMNTPMRLLNEMPWFVSDKDGKEFDLELENFTGGGSFVYWLKDVFEGKEVEDHFGNKLKLSTLDEKVTFAKALSNNSIFKGYIEHKFTPTEKALIEIILNF